MTWSHHCWFITNIWKADHCRLNMTLGTDIKFTLSFLSAKWVNPCVAESELCFISSFQVRTIWTQMGRAYLVTWTVLCFQFHTHWSLQHSKASCYFRTVAELHLPVQNYAPQCTTPLPKLRLTWKCMHKCSQPKGTPLGNEDLKISTQNDSCCNTCPAYSLWQENGHAKPTLFSPLFQCHWTIIISLLHQSQTENLPLLTVFLPQLISIPNFCYSHSQCVCLCVCVCVCVLCVCVCVVCVCVWAHMYDVWY